MSQECLKCDRVLPIDRFSRQSSAKNGYRKTCKDCHNAYVREVWYAKNSDKQKKASAEWKSRNQARVLATRYGATEEEIQRLLDIGICQICSSSEELCIDHCHDTGKVRGILCKPCNYGLGWFRDNLDRLGSAMVYLQDEAG